MASGLSASEEFLVRFNRLKEVGGTPKRVLSLYNESTAIRDALRALDDFIARTDIERRLKVGPKVLRIRASGFLAAWNEYKRDWQFQISPPPEVGKQLLPYILDLVERDPEREAVLEERLWRESLIEQIEPDGRAELRLPDPEAEDEFDPLLHDGGEAIGLGIEQLQIEVMNAPDDYAGNSCRLAVGAFDYLTETIGLNLHEVFRRWSKVPPVVMPTHVANRYGNNDKGSLAHLLNEAVRAFTFGVPAAAIAMCRASLEMVLKQHYLPDQVNNWDLSNLIILAERKYNFIQAGKIDPIRKRANTILHGYHEADRLSEEDERTILTYLKTVKFLIERAPRQ